MQSQVLDRQIDSSTIRNSGIDLLKIIAMLLVVISHVTQTLCTELNSNIVSNDYVFSLGNSTTDVAAIILMLFFQFGALGNNLFFVCSAWFLAGRDRFSRKKAFSLLSVIWVMSVCILLAYLGIEHYSLSLKDYLKGFFPSLLHTNWYMTCYIVFLFIYPYLNKLIFLIDQKLHLRIVLFSSTLWIFATYVKNDLFFSSAIILWVTVFFLMTYLKVYCKTFMSNPKLGVLFVLIGIAGFVGQVVITNFAGLHIPLLSDNVMRWNNNCCPFYIMIAVGSLIIVLRARFKVRFINYISSLSSLIYLIHENYLFRTYTRPKIWQWLYTTYGYEHVVLLDLGFSALLFLVSILISAVFKVSVYPLVIKVSEKFYVIVERVYGRVEKFILDKIS